MRCIYTTVVVAVLFSVLTAGPLPGQTATEDESYEVPSAAARAAHEAAQAGGAAAAADAVAGKRGAAYARIPFAPADESSSEPSLQKFWNSLATAVEKRNVEFFKTRVDKNIKCGFGGEDGRANFFKIWKLNENPMKSELWQVLAGMIREGGAFDSPQRDSFVAPVSWAKWPDKLDGTRYLAVVGEDVNVRAEPNVNAAVVGALTNEIVSAAGEYVEPTRTATQIGGETWPWYHVRLPDGRTGYVWGKFVRFQMGYRMAIRRTGSEWRIGFLLQGD